MDFDRYLDPPDDEYECADCGRLVESRRVCKDKNTGQHMCPDCFRLYDPMHP